MTKKRVMVIVLMLLLVFSTGCVKKKSTETFGPGVMSNKIYTGTNGINMKFMENMPPVRTYDKSGLNILVELNNKGAFETSGDIYITGFDKNLIPLKPLHHSFTNLEPKSNFNEQGGFEKLSFEAQSFRLPEGTDSFPVKMLVSMCYPYETKANPVVCIDPKLYDVDVSEKACEARDISLGGGQGAPVAVTRVSADTIEDKVHFKIDIANVGGGEVIRRSSVSSTKCPFDLEYADLNKVRYDIDMTSGSLEKCNPSNNEVPLTNGRGSIYCTFRVNADNSYQTPIKIKLDYGYVDSISKNVEIVRIPN